MLINMIAFYTIYFSLLMLAEVNNWLRNCHLLGVRYSWDTINFSLIKWYIVKHILFVYSTKINDVKVLIKW